MNIQIPGYKTLDLSFLVLDYNGTIAVDGQIPLEVREALVRLSKDLQIHVLTADTHGTARAMCQGLPLTIQTFPAGSAMDSKLAIVRSLGPERCVSIGNGRNDCLMCKESALSISVIGAEGAYSKLLSCTDLCTTSIPLSTELQMHLLYNTTLFQNLQEVPANFLYIFLRPPISLPGSRTLVSGFSQTGLSVLDGLFRTPADAGHTVGTV